MKYSYLFLLFLGFLCTSCNDDFSVQYRIQNNTGTIVEVSGSININGPETISVTAIDTLSSITIAEVNGSGESTSDHISDLNQLISDGIIDLTIINVNGAEYNRDPLDPSVWQSIEPIDDNDPGFILLDLNPADFL